MAEGSIRSDIVEGSNSLYFIFGGIQGAIGMPPYEFYRAAGVLNASKVFIRDFSQAWYQRGLSELGPTLAAIDEFLLSTIARCGATRVRFVGNSMGGFAALLFCGRLKRGTAIAFSPQTFLSQGLRAQYRDDRWHRQIAELHAGLTGDEILELRPFLLGRYPDIQANVYVASDHPLDLVHARALADFPNVKLHTFEGGGHSLVRDLRDAGRLTEILNS